MKHRLIKVTSGYLYEKEITLQGDVYYCPTCEEIGISPGDSYCFSCGAMLEWNINENERHIRQVL